MLTEYDARTVIVNLRRGFREQLLDGTLRFNDNHRCIMVSRKSLFGYHYLGRSISNAGHTLLEKILGTVRIRGFTRVPDTVFSSRLESYPRPPNGIRF